MIVCILNGFIGYILLVTFTSHNFWIMFLYIRIEDHVICEKIMKIFLNSFKLSLIWRYRICFFAYIDWNNL